MATMVCMFIKKVQSSMLLITCILVHAGYGMQFGLARFLIKRGCGLSRVYCII